MSGKAKWSPNQLRASIKRVEESLEKEEEERKRLGIPRPESPGLSEEARKLQISY